MKIETYKKTGKKVKTYLIEVEESKDLFDFIRMFSKEGEKINMDYFIRFARISKINYSIEEIS